MTHLIEILVNHIIPTVHAATEASEAPQGITGLLGLNLKLFIAQLVNFSIVLFVLWKWVFGPLGKKLQERTETIEKSLKHAEEIEQKHKDAESARLAEIEKARIEASEIITRAQKMAETTKDQIVAEAKAVAEKVNAQALVQIENEKKKLIAEVREEAATMVVAATERIIKEKLDPKRDEALIKESLKTL
jgi:F-type H+-transporting ATPase subunit b